LEKAVKTLPPGEAHLKIRAASAQNLKNVDVSIPLGLLTLVCGVSGSGKSTLILGILAKAAAFKLNGAKAIPASHAGIDGFEHLDSLVQVDQSPIGRSPRSNPATYTKLFDLLRELFAQCSLAKVRGYKSRRFSFNVPGGRCERCKGDGVIRMDMQFMADVYVECPSCQGKRYNRETLDIRYRGYSIADILDKTVDEALDIFQKVPKIAAKLKTLSQVGLGYLQLGQSATTLSGGEAQRIKLALELSKRQQGRSLYILDEPTTGLHASDIQNLMDLLFQLREEGHTIVMIEHDLNVIGLADWVIELGPVGGAAGGQVMYAGPIAPFLAGSTTPTQRAMISVD
jgi:excinuclease ABC subunit A